MADIAKTVVVSTDTPDSVECQNELTDNIPNCSNNNQNFHEIESFSELSFRTTDETSLQDLIDSELAARISSISTDSIKRAVSEFDELYPECEGPESIDTNLEQLISGPLKGDSSYIIDSDVSLPNDVNIEQRLLPDVVQLVEDENQVITGDLLNNYLEEDRVLPPVKLVKSPSGDIIEIQELDDDDYISPVGSPVMDGSPSESKSEETQDATIFKNSPREECLDSIIPVVDLVEDLLGSPEKEISPLISPEDIIESPADDIIYKPARPTEIIIPTNFDPFARIEEDSDSISNPVLNSPDEFQFPDSPLVETKELIETNEVIVDLFTKTYREEELDEFESKLHGMSSVESVNNSFQNVSNLTSPDRPEAGEYLQEEVVDNYNRRNTPMICIDEVETLPRSPDNEEEPKLEMETVIEEPEIDSPVAEPELIPDLISPVEEKEYVSPIVELEPELISSLEELEPDLASPIIELEPDLISPLAEPEPDLVSPIAEREPDLISPLAEPEPDLVSPLAEPEQDLVSLTTEPEPDLISPSKELEPDLVSPLAEPEPDLLSSPGEPEPYLNSQLAEPEPDLILPTSESFPDLISPNEEIKPDVIESPVEPIMTKVLDSYANTNCVVLDECLVSNNTNINVSKTNGFQETTSEDESESHSESITTTEKKTIKKKKTGESGLKKTKKTKKSDEKENISVKSSFSKFDQLSKKTVLHVRSVDASKVQKQFNDSSAAAIDNPTSCKKCEKQVFQMEQIKAERAVWHKNCFRCHECNKQLTVDTYSSNEGVLYCTPHFRELFKPKAVIEDDPEPTSDKPDLGLEELSSLNVKERYQVFERNDEQNELDRSPSGVVNVKRSPSILSKLAKFQKKGMDIGVTDDSLNGVPLDQSSTSEEEEEEDDEENSSSDKKVIKSRKIVKERPMSFGKMDDVKSVWENGVTKTKEELREERKQEIQQIRSRLFMGKQVKMKEAYEQAVRESETNSPRKSIDVRCDKAKSIKESFEKGEPLNVDDEEDEDEKKKQQTNEELSVFEAGISKKSRSLFLELDKSAKNTQQQQQQLPPKANRPQQQTAHETESPEKEVYRDPNVVRSNDKVKSEIIRTNTTAKMLSLFRQMEEKTPDVPDGPKPLKCFTPPPDYKSGEESEEESEEDDEEEEEEEEEDVNPNVVRASDKVEDEYLKQSSNAARAKQLRAKFEKWEEKEKQREREEQIERQMNGSTNNQVTENNENIELTSIECTKSLRARFESMKGEGEPAKDKVTRPKVNRFV